jgi:hypothetical protein
MELEKMYQVLVKAYHKQEVPKHTKYFSTEAEANSHKEELEGYLWNVPVNIEVNSVFVVIDGDKKYLLTGNFIKI